MMCVAVGKTANACVVMAQLISNGQNLGMHSFLVQIRDLDTHQPMPGECTGIKSELEYKTIAW